MKLLWCLPRPVFRGENRHKQQDCCRTGKEGFAMDLSIQAQVAATPLRTAEKRDPEPVNQRESMDAPAKRDVVDEATVSERTVVAPEVEVADYAEAASFAADLSSRIPAEPGSALGAQAQLATENALALLS